METLLTDEDVQALVLGKFPFLVKECVLGDIRAQLLADLFTVRDLDTEILLQSVGTNNSGSTSNSDSNNKNSLLGTFSPLYTATTPVSRENSSDVSSNAQTEQQGLAGQTLVSQEDVLAAMTPESPSYTASVIAANNNNSNNSINTESSGNSSSVVKSVSSKKSIWSYAGMGKSETAWSNSMFRGDRYAHQHSLML
jgi:hypothetical protein